MNTDNSVLFIQNSGTKHGTLVRRNKIPKTASGDFWHWKDFNIGIDVAMYGVVYHITDCDAFTRVSILLSFQTVKTGKSKPNLSYNN
jgi:hypothetical protein